MNIKTVVTAVHRLLTDRHQTCCKAIKRNLLIVIHDIDNHKRKNNNDCKIKNRTERKFCEASKLECHCFKGKVFTGDNRGKASIRNRVQIMAPTCPSQW